MPGREFPSWVEPIARRDREARVELLEVARSVPCDAWLRPSPLEGWTCKDLLAHLAGDTGKWFAYILRSVLDGNPLEPKRVGPDADVDALNGRDVDERRGCYVTELIAEIESDGEKHQEKSDYPNIDAGAGLPAATPAAPQHREKPDDRREQDEDKCGPAQGRSVVEAYLVGLYVESTVETDLNESDQEEEHQSGESEDRA